MANKFVGGPDSVLPNGSAVMLKVVHNELKKVKSAYNLEKGKVVRAAFSFENPIHCA